MTHIILFLGTWTMLALILAIAFSCRPEDPKPSFAEVFAVLPRHREDIITLLGPETAVILNLMQRKGLICCYNEHIFITRTGEEVMG